MNTTNRVDLLKNAHIEGSEIYDVTEVSAGDGSVFSALPSYVRVKIKSAPSKESLIYTELWLPEKWDKTFIATGNGGMAGKITYHVLEENIRLGCAVANTDMGTSRGEESGVDNPDVWKDFGWRATHIMTKVSKELTELFYGEKISYSYFIGGSTGGQQALCMAQRFGDEFDGIIAWVPANNRTHLHTYFLWNFIHLTDPDGTGLFSEDDAKTVYDCAVKFSQINGGALGEDNFVSDPYTREDTVAEFIKYLKENTSLSQKQLDALEAVYTGPVNPRTKERIYNGMPIGSEIYGCGLLTGERPEHCYPFIWTFGADYDMRRFNFDTDMDAVNNKLAADMNANSTNLDVFIDHGGKLIMISGSSDPCVPYPDACKYYTRLIERYGYEKISKSALFFIQPGRDHGSDGNGCNVVFDSEDMTGDVFYALRKWREEGIAPEHFTAVKFEGGKCIAKRRMEPFEEGKKFPPSCGDTYTNK